MIPMNFVQERLINLSKSKQVQTLQFYDKYFDKSICQDVRFVSVKTNRLTSGELLSNDRNQLLSKRFSEASFSIIEGA